VGLHLLDTSVFYRIGIGNAKNLSESVRKKLRATINAPTEIIARMGKVGEADFAKRAAALRAFMDTCGFERSMVPHSDARVARAFGCSAPAVEIAALEELTKFALESRSPQEFLTELHKQPPAQANYERVVEWVEELGRYFSDEVNGTAAQQRREAGESADQESGGDASATRSAVRARLKAIVENPVRRRATILGLAVRAGLVGQAEIVEARKKGAQGDDGLYQDLGAKAEGYYDGSLDFFVDCYAAFHVLLLNLGRQATANDLFDLDQLMFMNDDESTLFVTADRFSCDVVEAARPGRVMMYVNWLRAIREG
jgi:hypothetical protein